MNAYNQPPVQNVGSGMSGFGIFTIVYFLVGIVVIYYLYRYLYSSAGSSSSIVTIIPEKINANIAPTQLPTIPTVYEGGDYSFNTWIYISSFNTNRNTRKHIFELKGQYFSSLLVGLGAYNNTLMVRTHTVSPSTISEGFQNNQPNMMMNGTQGGSPPLDMDMGTGTGTGMDMGTGIGTGMDMGTGIGTGMDMGTGIGTGMDMGTGTGMDMGTGTGTGTGTGMDMGTGTGMDMGTSTATPTATGTGTGPSPMKGTGNSMATAKGVELSSFGNDAGPWSGTGGVAGNDGNGSGPAVAPAYSGKAGTMTPATVTDLSSMGNLSASSVNNLFTPLAMDDSMMKVPTMCDLPQIDLQRWTMVTVVLSGRMIDVYMDGKLSRSCTSSSYFKVDPTGVAPAILDRGGFDGYVANMSVANRVMNPDEIYKAYLSGPSGTKVDPLSWITSLFKGS